MHNSWQRVVYHSTGQRQRCFRLVFRYIFDFFFFYHHVSYAVDPSRNELPLKSPAAVYISRPTRLSFVVVKLFSSLSRNPSEDPHSDAVHVEIH
jgi:hypothetical protein